MYAYIILGLFLALASLETGAGAVPPSALSAAAGLAAAVAAVMVAGLAISGFILLMRHTINTAEQRFLRTVGILGRLYRLFVLVMHALVLFKLDWAALAAHTANATGWMAPAFALAALPLVLLLAVSWTTLYWADRRLRALMFARAGTPEAIRHWTLPRYIEFMARQYLLVVLVPLLALVAVEDVIDRFIGPSHPVLGTLMMLGLVLSALILAGPWIRLCWRTEPMPDGPVRRRLEDLARRSGVRVGNILVWRTNLSIANGCMIGIFSPLRYILITDALLLALAPEEVEAVFAHEVAHVKYRHVWLYLVFAAGAAGAVILIGAAGAVIAESLWDGGGWLMTEWLGNITADDVRFWVTNGAFIAAVLVVWGVGFGYVSRRFEQECDLYAVRATSCPAGCSPPDAGRVVGEGADPGLGSAQSLVAPVAVPGATDGLPDNGIDVARAVDTGGQAASGTPQTGPLSSPSADATAPVAATARPHGPVCEHRVAAMVTALRRIARLNGVAETARGWRHFSIARRCRFLTRLLADPALVHTSERWTRRLKMAVVGGALAAVIAAAILGNMTVEQIVPDDHREQPVEPEEPTEGAETILVMGPPHSQ